MSNTVLAAAVLIVAGILALACISAPFRVGQPRPPLTASEATAFGIISAVLCTFLVLAAVQLLN